MPILTEQQLAAIMTACPNPATWTMALNSAMERFQINDTPRMAAFLAQIGHESGQLTRLTENLNYSAKRLMQVWPKRFPSLERAHGYEKNPQKLANLVYAGRLGNGGEGSFVVFVVADIERVPVAVSRHQLAQGHAFVGGLAIHHAQHHLAALDAQPGVQPVQELLQSAPGQLRIVRGAVVQAQRVGFVFALDAQPGQFVRMGVEAGA